MSGKIAWFSSIGLSVVLAFSLSSCAPTLGVASEQPYTSARPYTGPISGVAIVMSTPQQRYRELADSAYSFMVSVFSGHPYARARYDMIERSEIERIIEEHRLSADGFVDQSTAPMLGQLLGAQYIVVVDLINADIRSSGVSGVNVGGVRLGGGVATVTVAVSSRLIDATTGRVLATGMGTVTGTAVTGARVGSSGFGSEASLGAAIDLFPEAAMRSLNQMFSRLG